MKFHIPKTLWLVPVVMLTLLGAGCFSPSEVSPAPSTEQPPAPSVDEGMEKSEEAIPDEATKENDLIEGMTFPSGYELPEIDETWKAYTNQPGTYSFQYPTQGKYAPTWGAKIIGEDDISLREGCYDNELGTEAARSEPRHVTLNGIEFCHLSLGDGFAGGVGLVDTYTTKVGDQTISLVFEKATHNPGPCADVSPACRVAIDAGVSVLSYGNQSYAVFYPNEYQAHLDQIVRTFTTLP